MSTFVLAGDDQSPENLESISLLYRIDFVLLSITGLFVVAKLPQVIALFGTTSEWFDGYFLHCIPYSPSYNQSYLPSSSKTDLTSNISHTLHFHDTLPTQRVTEKGTPVTMRYPPHVGSCTKFLYPILELLRLRTSPGFSIAQSLIFFIYFICLVYATFYKSNIFTDQTRTGWVAITQLPFIFLLAQKNNVLGLLLGSGYEKVTISQRLTKKKKDHPEISNLQLNFLHRFGGRLVVLAANIHALCHSEFV
jgi:ferric-chelate reductase